MNPTFKQMLIGALALLTLGASLNPTRLLAEELRYVSDVMYIPLRRGPSNQQDIVLNGLVSGTALTFLREETDTARIKWSQVRTAEGVTGWARSQHLLSEPTAALKIEALDVQKSQLQQELDSLNQQLARARDLESENQRLHENYQLLQTRADFLQAENDQLKRSDRYNQWIYGGGLLVCGVFLSFFLQGLGRRRRQTDWR